MLRGIDTIVKTVAGSFVIIAGGLGLLVACHDGDKLSQINCGVTMLLGFSIWNMEPLAKKVGG